MAASGSALNWLAAHSLAPTPAKQAARIRSSIALAAAVPAGSDGVLCLPYFLGEKTPIHDPLARGTFTGLSLSHGRGHLWRALLEAVAYGFRHHIEVLDEIGHAPTRFFASDGGSQSRVWMQIVADVLQQPVQLLANHHGSCVGAAWVAAIGSGQDVGWEDIGGLVRPWRLISPIPAHAAVYDRGYRDSARSTTRCARSSAGRRRVGKAEGVPTRRAPCLPRGQRRVPRLLPTLRPSASVSARSFLTNRRLWEHAVRALVDVYHLRDAHVGGEAAERVGVRRATGRDRSSSQRIMSLSACLTASSRSS